MNGKTVRKPRSRSGSAASNSELDLPSSTAQSRQCTCLDSTSEHIISSSSERPPKPQQISHGQCPSVAEKCAIGDGVHSAERLNPAAKENSADSAEESSTCTGSNSKPPDLDFSNPVFKKLARLNGEINRMHKEQLRIKLAELHLNTGGVKEVLKKRLKNYYRRKKLAVANVAKEVEPAPYDFLVVIDYEATCQANNDHFVQEIIEFPAVLVEVKANNIVGMFREFCKPVLNPKLTEFCKTLTGVNQSEVDSASEFPVVLEKFERWLESWELGTRYKFLVVTDGPWDMRRFLFQQCRLSQVPLPRWGRRWVNIRKSYGNFYDRSWPNLNSMLENLGLRFEGRPHCGLDDSKNIARIVCHMLEDGCALKVNEKLDAQLDFSKSPCGVSAEERNPSGDFKPPSKKATPNSGGVLSVSDPSRLGSLGDMKESKAVKEAVCLDGDEDVSDLMYYFSLQSA